MKKYTKNPAKSLLASRHFRLGAGVALVFVASLVAGGAQASLEDDVNTAADDAEDARADLAAAIADSTTNGDDLTALYIDFNTRHDVALRLVDDVDICGRDCPFLGAILQGALGDYAEAKQTLLDFGITQGFFEDEFCCSSLNDGVCSGFPNNYPGSQCPGGYITAGCSAPGSSPNGGIFCGDPDGWE